QAAESLRELLEKIPWITTGNTKGQRRERIAKNFAASDPLWTTLPLNFRENEIAALFSVYKELESFAHHNNADETHEFERVLSEFEESLWRILAPVTAEHQARIRQLLSK